MSSTALVPLSRPDVGYSYEAMRAHLAVKTLDRPQPLAEEPPIAAQLALAAMHLGFAAIHIIDAVRRVLLRVSRPWPLIGLAGCAYAVIFTVLFIWR